MTSCTDQTVSSGSESAQPKWYRVYFVLAAFNIITVCVSLSMNHRLMEMYDSSVDTNRVWADRMAAFAKINSLAAQTNAPGNNVFESRDADGASARLDAKFASFSRSLDDARHEIRQNLSADIASSLLSSIGDAETAMRLQVVEARRIFAYVRSKDMKGAGERMAAMDRAYYDVTEALVSISCQIQDDQHGQLEKEVAASVSMRYIEYFIVGLIAVMVVMAVLYGRKLAKRAKETESQTRALIANIEATNLALEGQKEEAEAINAELRETNAALETARVEATKSTRAKSEFLANMSHEIRTPMTAILGFAETIAENVIKLENVEAIATVRKNGESLLGIINDILDLSKVEAGQMTVERIAFKPCEIIAEVANLVRIRADAKGLAFNIEYIGAIPETIQSDPTRLRQILINLIGNSIKFTEDGAVRLIVRCVKATKSDQAGSPTEPYMQFDVLDTGLGMSDEQATMLFKPFSQADTSTTRKFGGTGLGLTISRRFAELLGGDITLVESEVGVGTRFRATLAIGALDGVTMLDDPMSATAVAVASRSTASVLPSDLRGLRILLAEDGPDNQRLISFVLKKAGADVTVVENGKLALDAALTAGVPFDVIIMDMQMPVMDGYEATRQLRRKGYSLPIIALTAHAMASDRDDCLDAGCDDYATKPIDRKELIETIQRNLVPAGLAVPS